MKLSKAQIDFISKLRNGKSVTRSASNVTATSLHRLGLVKYQPMFGWSLTALGASCELEIEK